VLAAVAIIPLTAGALEASEEIHEHKGTEVKAATHVRPSPLRASPPAVAPSPASSPSTTIPRPPEPVNLYRFIRPADMSPNVARFPERVYVPDNATDSVQVIDPKTFRVVDQFKVGNYPQHITPSWDLQHLYVENSGEDTLTVIDPKSGRPTRTIQGIPAPYNLYFTPDGTKAIDVAEYQNLVEFRNPHTWTLLGVVHVPWAGSTTETSLPPADTW
jgi:YVTN family beta-propeller protein